MEKISLNGSWTLKNAQNNQTFEATVPGTQYCDLLRSDAISNPFLGTNEAGTRWVGEQDWVYFREFDVAPDLLQKGLQELCFDRLDTICTVTLNGEVVLKAQNMHLTYCVDVRGKLREAGNTIELYFTSPVQYVAEKNALDKMPTNMNGVSGVPHIRKAQCHFGWDWGPIIPVVGAEKDVFLQFGEGSKITSFEINQSHFDGKVAVFAKICASGEPCSVNFELQTPSGEREIKAAEVGETVEFLVQNPELWWTNDLSSQAEQPLYTLKAELVAGEIVADSASKKIGLRTIVLDRESDQYGTNFRFILNGIPLFIKGANWIPADALPNRVDQETYRYYLQAMRNANQNMVRVWGGGTYEADEFYDICDRFGILVWQDLAFACAPYPFYDEAFLQNVEGEIAQNVLRLKHHASLALWCGNNEIEAMTAGWITRKKLVEWTKKFFWQILPQWMQTLDAATPFVAGSPIGTAPFKNLGSDNHGDTHLWQVWHGLKSLTYYRTRFTRFCSEFGLESLPDMRTIREFAGEESLSLASDTLKAHQKCASGNNKMLYYMATRFRSPKNFEDLVYYTQIIQSECVRDATEHFRRNRGRCNGAIYWQLNDCWPVSSWSSIDYCGRYKVLQYRAKECNAPVTLTVEQNKTSAKVFLLNDKREAFCGEVNYRLVTFLGKEIVRGRVGACASGTESVKLMEIDIAKYRRKYHKQIVLELVLQNNQQQQIASRTVLFDVEKHLKFVNPEIEKTVFIENGEVKINLFAKNFAEYVCIRSPYGTLPYSDYAFSMMPQSKKTVTVPLPQGVSAEDYLKSLEVVSLYDIEPRGTRFSDFFLRLKIHLIPINIANWIYYSFT